MTYSKEYNEKNPEKISGYRKKYQNTDAYRNYMNNYMKKQYHSEKIECPHCKIMVSKQYYYKKSTGHQFGQKHLQNIYNAKSDLHKMD